MTTLKRVRGFTLLELLAVITIIGILATLAAVGVSNATRRGRDAVRNRDLTNLKQALELYSQDQGNYPIATSIVTVDTSTTLIGSGTTPGLVTGGYITTLPKDPRTGRNSPSGQAYRYVYRSDATGQNFVLRSVLEYKNVNSGLLPNPPFANCNDNGSVDTVTNKGNGVIKGAAAANAVSCVRLTND